MKLIIMRGLPGSGKSTKARELAGSTANICSADDYFVEGGVYKFDPALLGAAHAQCLEKATDAMRAGVVLIVIDNTNTQKWEYEKYLSLAATHGYETQIEVVGGTDDATLGLYAERNSHGVPLDAIKRMAKRFEK